MGSRIMHLIIGNKVADTLSIQNKTTFLLGSIAADAASLKDLSHFYKGSVNDYSRYIDYIEFIQKYNLKKDNCFIQGYYTHLIADDIWLKGFYLPWLKNRIEKDENILNRYHNDFKLLNGKLLDYYGFTQKFNDALPNSDINVDIDEVKSIDLKQIISATLSDMDYDRDDLKRPLTVFTFDQIIGYIETSVDKSVMSIRSLL